ncbi:MAG: HIT family protein, partial [Actinobacteria bacterium]|nr:HIT family protein [Actinomycetota bacterium]
MPSIFTRIIAGEIPARFVWTDDACVAFLDVRPLAHGHVLVVPRVEVDQWTDLDAATAAHLMTVAHRIGQAQKAL